MASFHATARGARSVVIASISVLWDEEEDAVEENEEEDEATDAEGKPGRGDEEGSGGDKGLIRQERYGPRSV